jgi:hypothetical protein
MQGEGQEVNEARMYGIRNEGKRKISINEGNEWKRN